jgi:hypothetical protein
VAEDDNGNDNSLVVEEDNDNSLVVKNEIYAL